MRYDFRPNGVCSRNISFDLEDGIVKNVEFTGGCSGNTQGLARLCDGRSVGELITLLKGIKCGFKSTSCPDQLSKALETALSENK